MDGWMDGWMDGQINALMDGWMDGWTVKCMKYLQFLSFMFVFFPSVSEQKNDENFFSSSVFVIQHLLLLASARWETGPLEFGYMQTCRTFPAISGPYPLPPPPPRPSINTESLLTPNNPSTALPERRGFLYGSEQMKDTEGLKGTRPSAAAGKHTHAHREREKGAQPSKHTRNT
ncbi:hypothetical protein QQF64_001692 [Cirrhinus molitorella]|uniref:Uncharacterized protein n=1 Tax=Cirrhinus molitorella TaxID=172907 RepID=A0ABR3P184_9TELE